jgi:CheY-like chemotaxis protein
VRRILVAEDVEVNSRLIVHLLEERGHRVTAVENGAEAVKLLEQEEFDLVLMDDRMPVMDGCEATRIIRDCGSRVRRNDIPVIALSANVLGSDQMRFREAGMNDWLSKPVRANELLEMVARYGGGAVADRTSVVTGPAPVVPAPPAAANDGKDLLSAMKEEILDRYGGDKRLVDELLVLFRQEIPVIVKNAAGSVGFAGLAAHAEALERAAGAGDRNAAGEHLRLLQQEADRFLLAASEL